MSPASDPANKPTSPRSYPSIKQRISKRLKAARGHSRLIPLAAILLVLVPIGFAGLYSYQNTALQTTQTVLARRESFATLMAAVLTEKLDRTIDLGVSLSTRVRFLQLVEAGHWNDAIKIMAKIPGEFPYVDRLFLVNPHGALMADTPALSDAQGKNFSDQDWYRGVTRTGKPYISEIFRRTAVPRNNAVSVAVPIRNSQQTLIGILVLEIKLEAFSEWFKDVPIDPLWLVYIVDRKGRIAFHPRLTAVGDTADYADVPSVQRVLRGEQGVDIEPADAVREERVAAHIPVERYGWGIILEEPTRTAFAPRDDVLRQFSIIYLLMLATGGIATYLLIRAREDARHKADLEILVAERTVELESANKELQAFCYSVSHDLRGPLRSVDGFSRILLEDSADKLDAENASHLHRIRAAAQRMGELIDDLLHLSKVTRAEMRRARVDLTALAHAIVDDLRGTHPERRVTVNIQPGMTAIGDSPLLRVMLENLFDNAWKFTSKTRDAHIDFRVEHGRKMSQVYVIRDNGAGFDATYADKLFGTFQRLHNADEFPGTGIGLATVQRIVQRHGGQIWAESAVGKGAAFHFTLP